MKRLAFVFVILLAFTMEANAGSLSGGGSGGGGGNPAFSAVTAGTNLQHLTIGQNGVLDRTGNGSIDASLCLGVTCGTVTTVVPPLQLLTVTGNGGATITMNPVPTNELGATGVGNITIDLNGGAQFAITLTGNTTLQNPLNPVDGTCYEGTITQDGVGGHTLTYPTKWVVPGGGALTAINSAINAVTRVRACYRSSTDKYEVFVDTTGGGGGGGTPAGATDDVQTNVAGAFGVDTGNITTDRTNHLLNAKNGFVAINGSGRNCVGWVPPGTDTSQAVINAAPVTGGDICYGTGTYTVNTTVDIGNGTTLALSTRYGINLVGASSPPSSMITSITPATKFICNADPCIRFKGVLEGGGVQRIGLFAGSPRTGSGIKIISAKYLDIRDNYLEDFHIGIDSNTLTSCTPCNVASHQTAFDSYGNQFTNNRILIRTAGSSLSLANATVAVKLDGSAATANTDFNHFRNNEIFCIASPTCANVVAFWLAWTDSNTFDGGLFWPQNLDAVGFTQTFVMLDFTNGSGTPQSSVFINWEHGGAGISKTGADPGLTTALWTKANREIVTGQANEDRTFTACDPRISAWFVQGCIYVTKALAATQVSGCCAPTVAAGATLDGTSSDRVGIVTMTANQANATITFGMALPASIIPNCVAQNSTTTSRAVRTFTNNTTLIIQNDGAGLLIGDILTYSCRDPRGLD